MINIGQNSITDIFAGTRNVLAVYAGDIQIWLKQLGGLVVGGSFLSYDSKTIRFAALNTNGSLNTDISTGLGFSATLNAIENQADGKILVGGSFLTCQGIARNRIVRLNTNGSLDNTFSIGTGVNNTVQAIAIQSDGKILIGGNFTSYNGTTSNRIIRLNTDGSIDNSFAVGTGFNSNVHTINIQPDGKILIGGGFSTYQGTTSNRIIRLNANGSIDGSFVTGTGFNGTIRDIALQSDDKIVIAGEYSTYNGATSSRIIRLNTNGSIDTSFVVGAGFNNFTFSTSIQSDDKILVGGQYTTYQGTSSNRIIRLNTNGSIDTSFIVSTGFNGTIQKTKLQSDGKVLIGGLFTSYQGVTRNRFVRLNTDGSFDTTFAVGDGFDSTVNAIAIQQSGKILTGGDFVGYQTSVQSRIAFLNFNGSRNTKFISGSGFNDLIRVTSIQADGKILVGGRFTTYQGTTSNRIIRLNANGSIDTSFIVGTGFNHTTAFAEVNTIVNQADGKILVGGVFDSYQGSSYDDIIRLNTDGTIDETFVVGSGFGTPVGRTNPELRIAVQSDGKILVGGSFETYQGTTSNRIIRLNTDGSIDASFIVGSGFNNSVFTIAIQSDNKIVMGGVFTTYQGTTSNRIIRLNTDGSIDASFGIGTGFNGTVNVVYIQPDNKILVGGSFTGFQVNTYNRIIRLNNTGSVDSTFVVGNGFNNGGVNSINVQVDGKILVGGSFTSYQNNTYNRIIRLNTNASIDSSLDFAIGNGFENTVSNISIA